MREQGYVRRAKLSPARTFKSPMDVVETNEIKRGDKVAILKSWEADELALLRAADEGMAGGKHAHLQKVRAALDHLSREPGSACGDGRASVSLNQGLKMMGGG
jgi:hypothetical protein